MLLAGSILDRAPGRKYATALRFAELSLRAPLPRAGTLNAWRAALPEGFDLALRAPRACIVSPLGPLRVDAKVESALAWVLDAADALQARAVVLPTPADLAPGKRSRELLTAYAARLRRSSGRHYVWAPSGVWEPEETNQLCADLDLVRAFDPLQMQRPQGPVVYAQLCAMGHRSSFSQAALDDALSVITSEETTAAWVSVDSQCSFEVAKRLQRLAAERGLTTFGAEPGADDDEPDDEEDESDEDELDEDADDVS